MTSTPRPVVEILLLALLALLWGSSYLFIKIAVAEIPPLTLIAIRVAGAAVFLHIVLILRRFSQLSAAATAAGTMTWATAVLLPAALILDAPWRLSPGGGAIAASAMLSILCTGVALLLYFRLVRTLGSMGVASQSYLRAGIGVALGVVLLGETVSLSVCAGLAAAILGVALINWPSRRRAPS